MVKSTHFQGEDTSSGQIHAQSEEQTLSLCKRKIQGTAYVVPFILYLINHILSEYLYSMCKCFKI